MNFNEIYRLSLPPTLRALYDRAQADKTDRTGLTKDAFAAAELGYKVDVPIMVWGWAPFDVMTMRANYGYTWVPAALGAPVIMAPGLHAPGYADYDALNPPAGSIRVSLNPNDYPPFDPPVIPVVVVPSASPVGADEGDGLHYQALNNGETLISDKEYIDPRGKFIYKENHTPFGTQKYFLKEVN